jgi:hypothetical protein
MAGGVTMSPSMQGLRILQDNMPKHDPSNTRDFCQCNHPDIVVEGTDIFCAICGRDIPFPQAALALAESRDFEFTQLINRP